MEIDNSATILNTEQIASIRVRLNHIDCDWIKQKHVTKWKFPFTFEKQLVWEVHFFDIKRYTSDEALLSGLRGLGGKGKYSINQEEKVVKINPKALITMSNGEEFERYFETKEELKQFMQNLIKLNPHLAQVLVNV